MSASPIVVNKSSRAKLIASYIMKSYNRAKVCNQFEIKRVHRAFGLAFKEMTVGNVRPYNSTTKNCNCPDSQRGYTCKHQIAKMIVARAKQYLMGDYNFNQLKEYSII